MMDIPTFLVLAGAALILIGCTLMIAQAVWPSLSGWPTILKANHAALALIVLGVMVLLASEALSPPNEYSEQ